MNKSGNDVVKYFDPQANGEDISSFSKSSVKFSSARVDNDFAERPSELPDTAIQRQLAALAALEASTRAKVEHNAQAMRRELQRQRIFSIGVAVLAAVVVVGASAVVLMSRSGGTMIQLDAENTSLNTATNTATNSSTLLNTSPEAETTSSGSEPVGGAENSPAPLDITDVKITAGVIVDERFVPREKGNIFSVSFNYRNFEALAHGSSEVTLITRLGYANKALPFAEVPIEVAAAGGSASFLIGTLLSADATHRYRLNFIVGNEFSVTKTVELSQPVDRQLGMVTAIH